eukprot:2048892-Rhodomonas_salina.1
MHSLYLEACGLLEGLGEAVEEPPLLRDRLVREQLLQDLEVQLVGDLPGRLVRVLGAQPCCCLLLHLHVARHVVRLGGKEEGLVSEEGGGEGENREGKERGKEGGMAKEGQGMRE